MGRRPRIFFFQTYIRIGEAWDEKENHNTKHEMQVAYSDSQLRRVNIFSHIPRTSLGAVPVRGS